MSKNGKVNSDVDYYNHPAISNSDLTAFRDSPYLFKLYKERKIKRITTRQLELGTLIHRAILEPESFIVSNINKPSGMMADFIDIYFEEGMTKEASEIAYKESGFKIKLTNVLSKLKDPENKKYLDLLEKHDGKLVLTKQQKYIISKVIEGIKRNPTANLLLNLKTDDVFDQIEVKTEKDIYGKLEGVDIKGKYDRLIIDHDKKQIILIDLKSTSSAPYFRFRKVQNTGDLNIDYQGTGFFSSFKGYCIYRQAAFYKTLIFQNYPDIVDKYEFISYIIPLNTTNSYDCSVVKLSDEWITFGRYEFEELIMRYKEHLKNENWDYPLVDASNGLIKL